MYLTLVLVATATPGPAVLYITTHSSLHGWRKAIFAALGNILGLFCLGFVAVTGLGAILNTSVIIFTCIKYYTNFETVLSGGQNLAIRSTPRFLSLHAAG
jgi:threonine/homoserine/homoserine lactone efflux protein